MYLFLCVCLGPHLQVNLFDPSDDTMRRPNQRIHILVLTLQAASLQRLEDIWTNTTSASLCCFRLPSPRCDRPVDPHLPLCQNWASSAARCPAASWPGGTSWWCWDNVQGRGAWGSSACVHQLSECGRLGSTEVSPRHLTRPWPPSGGPYLQLWTACRQRVCPWAKRDLQ